MPTKTLDEKLRKLASGELTNHTLTKEEGEELLKMLSDKTKLESSRKALGLDTVEQLTSLFPDLLNTASNGESYLTRLENKMKRGELTEKLSGAFNTLLNLSQLGVASNQISKSNKALGELKQPAIPTAPGEDPALSNAIAQAQQGTYDVSRAVAPVTRQIRNNRLRDENIARQVAGGQSGAYGALNQASSLRALGAYGEMAPLIDNIRAREQARLDNLLQMRQGNRQNDFENRMSIYDAGNRNYLRELNSAGELGQAGRENLFGALGGLSDNLAVLGGNLQGKNFNIGNKIASTTGIPELDSFNNTVNQNLNIARNPYFGRYAPGSGSVPRTQGQLGRMY